MRTVIIEYANDDFQKSRKNAILKKKCVNNLPHPQIQIFDGFSDG